MCSVVPGVIVGNRTGTTLKGEPMAWWGWLLMAWVMVACAAGVLLGLALRLAEKRDQRRRADEPTPRDVALLVL